MTTSKPSRTSSAWAAVVSTQASNAVVLSGWGILTSCLVAPEQQIRRHRIRLRQTLTPVGSRMNGFAVLCRRRLGRQALGQGCVLLSEARILLLQAFGGGGQIVDRRIDLDRKLRRGDRDRALRQGRRRCEGQSRG